MNAKSIIVCVLAAVSGLATGLAHLDQAHEGIWHTIAGAAIGAGPYFGLTSPDLSQGAATPKKEARL